MSFLTGLLSSFVIMLAFASRACAADCASLPPLECLASTSCTLDCELREDGRFCRQGRQYFCRPDRDRCEAGKAQNELTAKACESQEGCRYVPAVCFCPCDFDGSCNCACGGGRPPNCVAGI